MADTEAAMLPEDQGWRGKLRRWLRARWRADRPVLLSKEEAVARATAYAEAQGGAFPKPFRVTRERRRRQGGAQTVYVVTSTPHAPMPAIEVDAVSGEIVAVRVPPR